MTTYSQLAAMMGPDPLVDCIARGANMQRRFAGLGDATALTPQQSATLLNLGLQYASWRDQVLSIADRTGDGEGAASNLRKLVNAASRQFNKLIGGDLSMGAVLQQTMADTMAYIREVYADNTPTLNDIYAATGANIRNLVVSVTSTAGAAAGALIKSAADEAGVEPAEITGGVNRVALAIGAVAAVVGLSQLVAIFGRRR